jgi:DNA mismatch endonuclease (patch repair protein)
VDTVDEAKRSEVMGRVASHDTRPEKRVRSLLHRIGYRFTVNGPLNRRLPGKPDIVMPKYQAVVFVHGCFWHRHLGCPRSVVPKSNRLFWRAKFARNVARDRRVRATLKQSGWTVITIWECEIPEMERNPDQIFKLMRKKLLPKVFK